jgi:hypothetical protein
LEGQGKIMINLRITRVQTKIRTQNLLIASDLADLSPSREVAKNFPALYGTQRFITEFTRALHLSLS